MPVNIVRVSDAIFEDDAAGFGDQECGTDLEHPHGICTTIGIEGQHSVHIRINVKLINTRKEYHASEVLVRESRVERPGGNEIVGGG